MNKTPSTILGWIAAAILVVVVGRFGWLVHSGGLVFESDLTALLPASKDSWLVEVISDKVTNRNNGIIAAIIQSPQMAQTDAATDQLTEFFDRGMAQKEIEAEYAGELDFDLLSARIEAMLEYKDRLIGDRSRRRIQESGAAQLNWRMDQVIRFPPSNTTDPVADPLGTLDEFLAERLPSLTGVQPDGLYLRVAHDTPANLILLQLAEGEPGGESANDSARWIINAADLVAKEFDVKIYLSGIPLHAAAIKEQTVNEIHWMASLAVILTLGFFLYVTRSVRALLISAITILLAIAGGLVISFESIGLPHLVGLTMAITAVGICIDFSFHFWVHVRAGMDGPAAVKTIFSGLNMSFLTTTIGLLVITFTSIPVLARSAVFIGGVLLFSWLIVLLISPKLAGASGPAKPLPLQYGTLPRWFVIAFAVTAAFVSAAGLLFKAHTDDSPARLGYRVESRIQDDLVVRDLLGITGRSAIYLVEANSGETLLEIESSLLEPLTDNEVSRVEAVSRLVVGETQQRANQLLFKRAMDTLDAESLRAYLETLRVPALDWTSADEGYPLDWVLSQPWASIERNSILACTPPLCASMIRAQGDAVEKLDASCRRIAECSRISLADRQLAVFEKLRFNLMQALLLATGAVFIVLYFRYRKKAFMLITVPVLASMSGVAAVAWAGMPITVFTLAAVFPLLGLSIDYVVFASESRNHRAPTFLAIFASALTTALSFWILFFSSTPAVQFFALPVAVGIPVAWILVQIMRPNHA